MPKFRTICLLLILIATAAGCLPEDDTPLPTVVIPTREGGDAPVSTATVSDSQPAATETGSNPTATLDPAAATPTLAATATPEPTPTAAAPLTSLPIQQVSGSPLPPSGRDLLFIAEGALKRWNHRSGQIEVLISGPDPASRVRDEDKPFDSFVGDVTDFVVTPDGKRALVARRTGTIIKTDTTLNQNDTEEEIEIEYPIHELIFLDTVSGDRWTIITQVANLRGLALSPNAEQIVFVASSSSGDLTLDENDLAPEQIYLIAAGGGSNPGELRQIDSCVQHCFSPTWHIESNLVVWSDREALKLFNVAGSEAEILLPNQGDPPDIAIHTPSSWANNGRFLLIEIGALEGGSLGVFDVPTRTLINIPDSFRYIEPFPLEVMWMPDDRLFILRTGDALTPTAELWRLFIDDGNLVKEESLRLTDREAGAMGQQYLEDGRFAYALISDNPDLAGLYHLTSLSQQPEKVSAVPASPVGFPVNVSQVTWSAAGFGAIVVHNDIPYYGLAEGEFLYDMSAVFGADSHSFHWQPEIVLPQ